jgi:cytochrome c oxidase subunit 2
MQAMFCKCRVALTALLFTWILWIPRLAVSEVNTVPSSFHPCSAPARAIYELSVLVLAICSGIFVVVTVMLLFVVVRYRKRPTDSAQEPPQIYGSSQIELAWTVIPIIITLVLILVTARTIGEIQNKNLPEDALMVEVIGHQWWWEVGYPQYRVRTANEIHVPVSSSAHPALTRIILKSADVLHSFWVPQLAGKMQLVPNKINMTWIEPLQTGVYLGSCAQYCGAQHAFMLLRVIVHTPENFQRWVAGQKGLFAGSLAVAAQATSRGVSSGDGIDLAANGRKTFFSTACVSCHRIDGTTAQGTFGPDLTHLMSRHTIGAGVTENTHQNLATWVRDPQLLKPGCFMPDMHLTPSQIHEVVAYLETLR